MISLFGELCFGFSILLQQETNFRTKTQKIEILRFDISRCFDLLSVIVKFVKLVCCFSLNSLVWGSLLEKIGWPRAAICSGRVPELARLVSGPPCVRLVSALCLKSNLSIVSAFCPALCPLWPRLQTLPVNLSALPFVRHVSAMCPPCVRFARGSKACPPCPPCVRLVSALCPPLCWPWVRFGRASKLCPPCVGHASPRLQTLSALCPLWPRLQTLSAMWPPCHLSTMCPKAGLASGLCRLTACCGIISQNSFPPLRNPQRLYGMPAGQFPSYSFWLTKFGLCKWPYACKTVWGLCWYNLWLFPIFVSFDWCHFLLAAFVQTFGGGNVNLSNVNLRKNGRCNKKSQYNPARHTSLVGSFVFTLALHCDRPITLSSSLLNWHRYQVIIALSLLLLQTVILSSIVPSTSWFRHRYYIFSSPSVAFFAATDCGIVLRADGGKKIIGWKGLGAQLRSLLVATSMANVLERTAKSVSARWGFDVQYGHVCPHMDSLSSSQEIISATGHECDGNCVLEQSRSHSAIGKRFLFPRRSSLDLSSAKTKAKHYWNMHIARLQDVAGKSVKCQATGGASLFRVGDWDWLHWFGRTPMHEKFETLWPMVFELQNAERPGNLGHCRFHDFGCTDGYAVVQLRLRRMVCSSLTESEIDQVQGKIGHFVGNNSFYFQWTPQTKAFKKLSGLATLGQTYFKHPKNEKKQQITKFNYQTWVLAIGCLLNGSVGLHEFGNESASQQISAVKSQNTCFANGHWNRASRKWCFSNERKNKQSTKRYQK